MACNINMDNNNNNNNINNSLNTSNNSENVTSSYQNLNFSTEVTRFTSIFYSTGIFINK